MRARESDSRWWESTSPKTDNLSITKNRKQTAGSPLSHYLNTEGQTSKTQDQLGERKINRCFVGVLNNTTQKIAGPQLTETTTNWILQRNTKLDMETTRDLSQRLEVHSPDLAGQPSSTRKTEHCENERSGWSKLETNPEKEPTHLPCSSITPETHDT